MKSPCVREIEPGKVATGTFLVQSKDVRQKKTGEPYLSLVLGDRTGELDAKMWDNVAEVMNTFERDDFVRVKGLMQIYNNRPQFTLHTLKRVDDAAIDPADFFPASERDPSEMLAELREIVRSMQNPHLRALIELFLGDEEIARRYMRAPAAKVIHHAYLGGLIEHVLSVCRLCRLAASHYPSVDLDLLLAGAVLHDIGKIHELSYERSFGYTSEGQLLGHIAISLRMVEAKLAQLPDFPPRLRTLLEHLILSHHGALEFGSPKVPLFPEALLLHYLDDLDAKMECMRVLVEKDRLVEGDWTSYSPSLERVILKKGKYLGGVPAAAEDAAQPAPPTPAAVPPSRPAPPATDALPRPVKPPEPATPAAVPPPRPAPPATDALPRPLKPPEPVTPSLFGEKLGQALRGPK
jgi:3'-5' exoribonuclease